MRCRSPQQRLFWNDESTCVTKRIPRASACQSHEFPLIVGLRAALLLIVLLTPRVVCAQDALPAAHEPPKTAESKSGNQLIAEAAARSADQLDPSRIADVDQTREEFLKARESLIEFLNQGTSEAIAKAWIEYLEIDPVIEAIESSASDKVVAAKTVRVSHKATGVHAGLELEPIVRLRDAATRFGNALQFRSRENTTKVLGLLLGRIAEQWAAIESVPTPSETATLRLLLDRLNRTDQQIEFVDEAIAQFSSANLHVTISESLIRDVVGREVSKQPP